MRDDTWAYRYIPPEPPTLKELAAIEITREGRILFDKLSRKNQVKAVKFMRMLAPGYTPTAREVETR